jgi:hypothetical protein
MSKVGIIFPLIKTLITLHIYAFLKEAYAHK